MSDQATALAAVESAYAKLARVRALLTGFSTHTSRSVARGALRDASNDCRQAVAALKEPWG